jgi:uncharacterized membrane protein
MQKEHFLDRFHRNERLIGLSDGVFAIVLTLLVLELRVPQLPEHATATELWHALGAMRPKIISFLLSFLFIASLWFSHNQLFKLFHKVDDAMLWLNNFLLLVICFIPFPTALIGEYPGNPIGIALFGSIWVIVPLLIYLIGSRAYHKNYLHSAVDKKRYLLLRKLTLLYAPVSALPIAFAWTLPRAAFAIYILMMLGGIAAGFFVKVLEDAGVTDRNSSRPGLLPTVTDAQVSDDVLAPQDRTKA